MSEVEFKIIWFSDMFLYFTLKATKIYIAEQQKVFNSMFNYFYLEFLNCQP